jgi:hypothetical protein
LGEANFNKFGVSKQISTILRGEKQLTCIVGAMGLLANGLGMNAFNGFACR